MPTPQKTAEIATIFVVISIVFIYLMDVVIQLGLFRSHHRHYPGPCKDIYGAKFGSKDFQVTSDGLIFITSGLGFTHMPYGLRHYRTMNNVKGRILLYDLKNSNASVKSLPILSKKKITAENFQPHGIGILEDPMEGKHVLYVINHPDGQNDRVEKFRYLPGNQKLVHEQTYQSHMFRVIHDIALIAEDQFYVSSFQFFKTSTLSMIEHFLHLPLGGIIYFNGTDAWLMVALLYSPNGLTLSKDGRYLYVSMSLNSMVKVYARRPDHTLIPIQSAPVFTAPDNLHLSPEGDALYAGCQSHLYKLSRFLEDPAKGKAPSQVLRLPLLPDGKIDVDGILELIYDHGDLISGSSVAVVYNKTLFIGSIFHKLVTCDVNVPI